MTPKEKAKELFYNYSKIQENIEWTDNEEILKDCEIHNNKLGLEGDYYWHQLAKQCALIAVDELIQLRKGYFDCTNPMQDESYWQEVKKEILS